MNFFSFITQDWKANKGNTKGRLVMLHFRIANFCAQHRALHFIGLPYLVFYKLFVEWFLGIEIPWKTRIGRNCRMFHGQSLVINSGTVIGENCTIRHCTTIGNKQLKNGNWSSCPLIGNHVDIGSNVCIIGNVYLGDYVKVGSGAVVTKDVNSHCTVVGNPAVELRTIKPEKIAL